MHSKHYKYMIKDRSFSDEPEIKDNFEKDVMVTFHHNGDYSGEVWIQINQYRGTDLADPHSMNYDVLSEAKVPYWMLETLVAEKIRSDLISKIEDIDGRELLARAFDL